jgi:hypothetical protein
MNMAKKHKKIIVNKKSIKEMKHSKECFTKLVFTRPDQIPQFIDECKEAQRKDDKLDKDIPKHHYNDVPWNKRAVYENSVSKGNFKECV